jgi:CRP-like cAMP-binding protein
MEPKRTSPFSIASFLAEPRPGRTVPRYMKNEIIYSQGDPSNAVFFVLQGKVKATVVSEQGKEAVAGIFGPDEFFGESCLAGHQHRLMTVTALTDVLVVRIEKALMIQLLQEHREFSQAFMTYILNRTVRVEADLVDQLFNSSEKRLARLLLIMAKYGKDGNATAVIPNVTQETLAEMIGTTRSRVNFFMNRFRKLGFINYNDDEIEIHESLLSSVLHETPVIEG